MADKRSISTKAGEFKVTEELEDKELDRAAGGFVYGKITHENSKTFSPPEKKPAEF